VKLAPPRPDHAAASAAPAPIPGGGALTLVRSATTAAHRRSERCLLATDPFASLDRYRALLVLLGRWELSVRSGLAGATSEPIDHERMEHRRQLVRDDLAALSSVTERDPARPAVDRPVAALRPFRPDGGRAGALGARYVVEGSRSGGKVLAATAVRRLGPDTPTAFLTDHDRTGWDEVTAALLVLPATEAGPAVATAQRAFALVEHYLEGRPDADL
jgi:heme oxygenase